MPVLPAVPSTITPPGLSRPRSSASLMMNSAARSLTEPPGLRNSALPRIVHPVSSEARRNLISGVFPTVPMKPSRIFMPCSVARACRPTLSVAREEMQHPATISAARDRLERPDRSRWIYWMAESRENELFPAADAGETDRQRDATTGLLPSQLLREAVALGREILSPQPIDDDQIQPASIDLRLGEMAYRVRASFLPGPRASVRDKLDLLSMQDRKS